VAWPTSNLTQRILTALVGAVVVVCTVWAGGWAFALAITAIGLLAQHETYGMFEKAGTRPFVWLGLGLGALAVLRVLLPLAEPLLVLGALAVLGAVLYRRQETPLLDAAATLFGVAYPAALCGSLVALRVEPRPWLDGGPPEAHAAFWLTTAVLFCVWGADTFAYFTGRAFGRRPLFARVSPKKTWEGAVGGAVGALLLAAGFKLFTPLDPVLTWADVAAVAVACGVASPFGDLAESLFKRSVGVKDSATLLPGHGGMLDRIDAAVVAVPLVVLWFDLVKG
jgi:phosphatidate cytidylyltransferase